MASMDTGGFCQYFCIVAVIENLRRFADSVVGVVAPGVAPGDGCSFSSLSVIVEVEGDRAKALKDPRWVSLSSAVHQHTAVA